MRRKKHLLKYLQQHLAKSTQKMLVPKQEGEKMGRKKRMNLQCESQVFEVQLEIGLQMTQSYCISYVMGFVYVCVNTGVCVWGRRHWGKERRREKRKSCDLHWGSPEAKPELN